MKIKLIAYCHMLCALCLSVHAQGTAFTYQGRLNDGANPASGSYDLTFALFNAGSGAGQVGGTLTNTATPVTNGLFIVTLDFGANFPGASRWLEIGVRTNGNGAFTTLAPRQPLTSAPYAIFANTASNLSGTIANGSLPSSPNFSGTVTGSSFSGSGANVTNVNAGNISSGTLSDSRLSGNVALRTSANTFTVAQFFNGQIVLNSSDGFAQSSLGAFYIDAPFIGGGRFTVLANGNVGIGTNNPVSKLFVNGDATVSSSLNLPATATINAGTNRLLFADTNQNVFAGQGAGKFNSTGVKNTANGYQALYSNTNSSQSTAVGYQALYSNIFGTGVTAIGYQALYFNVSGFNDTSIGYQALYSNTGGYGNTADGYQALYSTTNSSQNTAVGYQALLANTGSDDNTAIGAKALQLNTVGDENTAIGTEALSHATGSSENTAVGAYSLILASGSGNIALGYEAGHSIATGGNNIDIGNIGNSSDTNTIRIGSGQTQTFIAGIFGATGASGVQVYVNSSGQLGTLLSSERFKQNIRSMGDESDVLLALRPVAFQYKPDLDPQGLLQFGLIAEEVDKVAPGLVARDDKNQIYTVRYQAVDAMLLNEFLKQHQKITGQIEEIQNLKQQNNSLEKRLNELETAVASLAKNK